MAEIAKVVERYYFVYGGADRVTTNSRAASEKPYGNKKYFKEVDTVQASDI